ncbi:transmembrane protein, putative (macronuclear) [Tetrahymena thermophila SB210]|uniref:Transmembrane protein, putative n=1 Tax=Tetrahymena thermophila (strain SB210) TaxID=312017 RepID=W7XIK9_TETTS|nr:transmembrane protein, putative [Tetrahymena thermophila SB210]EWS73374.1 transmembrane protein, putative [Tetrahymena thermophila SB210]|eukprot:XP_012654107.1 transmembrane protein, putative [Tetrahymena thermophila SB210]
MSLLISGYQNKLYCLLYYFQVLVIAYSFHLQKFQAQNFYFISKFFFLLLFFYISQKFFILSDIIFQIFKEKFNWSIRCINFEFQFSQVFQYLIFIYYLQIILAYLLTQFQLFYYFLLLTISTKDYDFKLQHQSFILFQYIFLLNFIFLINLISLKIKSYNPLQNEGVSILASSLAQFSKLSTLTLDLRQNSIGDSGASNLSYSLNQCHNLSNLTIYFSVKNQQKFRRKLLKIQRLVQKIIKLSSCWVIQLF